jgi:GLPGLI family protein
MKKLVLAAAMFVAVYSNAQVKEGMITYGMTIEGLPAEQAAMMGDMEMKLAFKDKKAYSETSSMMFSSKTVADENGMTMLMEQMGNKSYMKMSKADMDKQKDATSKGKEPKIEYLSDTKTIAGYECKKAVITMEGKEGETKSDVWYTEKIPYVSAGGSRKGGTDAMGGLKGLPMEYSMMQGPMKIKMSAKQVSLAKVPDSMFALSTEGYTEIKMDDLKKMTGAK